MTLKGLLGNSFLLFATAICFPIFLFGCFIFPYPSLKHVSSVNVGSSDEEVHCFRVEATKHDGFLSSRDGDLLLDEVSISRTGRVDGQFRLTIDSSGQALIGGPVKNRHEVRLRVYRRGYETVEIKPEDDAHAVTWKAVRDSGAQEKAVDDLLFLGSRSQLPVKDEPPNPAALSLSGVQAGSASAAHRKALLFAASEYERLAAQLPAGREDTEQTGKRLLDKTSELKDLAAK